MITIQLYYLKIAVLNNKSYGAWVSPRNECFQAFQGNLTIFREARFLLPVSRTR